MFISRDARGEVGVLERGAPPAAEGDEPLDIRWATSPVAVGEVLNHIYKVTRYIADGGMGEVYEGVNVNTDERVAIKVILPRLAEDPTVLAMFRREARTLTRMSHQALVQYRTLAQEPTTRVLYIVTEFIDGVRLDQVIGDLRPTDAELLNLTRRLAEGLRAAHELGAIHRDISPDNILLPYGRVAEAKIIDFGIAKDSDSSLPGFKDEAFAGKLSFAAPEQLGDFDRRIGPWTDVYSLGLVMLSLAAGHTISMGATLTEAIERHRQAPDLTTLPQSLRRVFGKMLAPDPKNRFQSMGEVVEALDAVERAGKNKDPLILNIGRAAAALILVALVVGFFVKSARRDGSAATLSVASQSSLDAKLAAIPCAWLSDRLTQGPKGLHVRLEGAAGDPSAAELQAMLALESAGIHVADVDGSGVRGLSPAACGTLGMLNQFRSGSGQADLVQLQSQTFEPKADRLCHRDRQQATAVITLARPVAGTSDDLALVKMDQSGGMTRVFSGLGEFRALAASAGNGRGYRFEDLGKKGLRVSLCEKGAGVRGAIAIEGKPPFDLGLPALTAGSSAVSPSLPANIITAAKTQNWRAQAVWYDIAAAPSATTPGGTAH